MRKKILITAIGLCMMVHTLNGCIDVKVDPKIETYANKIVSVTEYHMHCNDSITEVLAQLTACMGLSMHTDQGTFPVPEAEATITNCMQKVHAQIEYIDGLMPPDAEKTHRENLLRIMKGCEADIQEYLDAVKESSVSRAQGAVQLMEGDYKSLSTLFQ